MSITQEEFDALVSRLEEVAGKSPFAYKLRVLLFALLGYAFIFSIVAILLGLTCAIILGVISGQIHVNFLFFKLTAVFLILTGIILRALWVDIEPPTGLALDPKNVSLLTETIDNLQTTLKAPKVHEVLLTGDFNASVAQIPRLGAFGWYKNYLTIGLPLMQALSPDQFRAVIAHEFGHLSGAHGRFSSWIYRIRTTWVQLLTQLEEREHWGSIIFVKFFEWYAPYFAAYSFVLARAQEYEADKLAAESAGKENIGDALVRLVIGGDFLEETFWPSVYQKADNQPEPPSTVYADLQHALNSESAPHNAEEVLKYAVSIQTSSEDTHPALSDRLAALGLEVRPVAPIEVSAAEYFIKDHLAAVTTDISRMWGDQVKYQWKERYRYSVKSQESLTELENKAKSGPLTIEEAWQRAHWTEEFRSSEAALPLYQEVLSIQPDHADALFSVGRILLSQANKDGIVNIQEAMRLKGDYTLPGCQLVFSFLYQNGEEDQAKEFLEKAINKLQSV